MHKRLILIISLLFITTGVLSSAADSAKKGILYTKPLESVIFSHEDHAHKEFSCATCHSGLFAMKALEVQKNKDFIMDSLYKGKYCGACHDGKKAFAADTQCARCHLGFGAKLAAEDIPSFKKTVKLGKSAKGVAFYHDKHPQSCLSCHPSLFVPQEGANKIRMADHGRDRYCFTCHDGKKAFAWGDCSRCHTEPVTAPRGIISFGKGKKAVAFRHETHQMKEGCKVCHPKLFAFAKGVARIDFDDHLKQKSCFVCHAKKNATAFYDCNRCHTDKKPPKLGGPDTLTYKTPMQNVYFHHESHSEFACTLCHPAPFAMKKGQTKMVMAEMFKGKTCGFCHNGKMAFHARECARCHKK